MSSPTVRVATSEDVDPIVALVTAAYRGEASTQGWTTEHHLLDGPRTDPAMVTEAVLDPAGEVLLAEIDGALVGCLHVRHEGPAGHFGMFAVDPTRQGSGTGALLLNHAEARARGWGCRTMDLDVVAQRAELIAWYERRGYRRTGETKPFPYDDPRFGTPRRDDLVFAVLLKEL